MSANLELIALRGLPMVQAGDDLAALIIAALGDRELRDGDVIVVAQKIVSKAEGRTVDLATVTASPEAERLGEEVGKDPRLVEVILSESTRVVRSRPNLIIVQHRLGFVMANAGVDQSNVAPADGVHRVLLLPLDPDASAETLRARLQRQYGAAVGVVVSDSFGRAWRRGTCGIAIGAAGLPSLIDLRGQPDLFGRTLEVSIIGFADEIAAAASLLQGQAAEAQPVVLVRGLAWSAAARTGRRPRAPAGGGSVPVTVVALSGGVGGAKLALGLSRVVPAEDLLVVCNTGDDFDHLGLCISPDIDTVMYTLAGVANPEVGWGRADETWSFMETLGALGGETWFRLGDRDVAVHVERTRRLRAGETLSTVTADLCRRLGVAPRVLPMSDDPVRTRVRTDDGWIDFQDYFVRQRCEPVVHELAFHGATTARAQPEFLAALTDPATTAIVICPSNPFISIEPILAVPGVRAALADRTARWWRCRRSSAGGRSRVRRQR
ncbi:MAG: coenzyme F420-0:L-glutamate ligase [Acetobacteraceae bacterium]